MPHVAARTASRDRDTGRYQSHRPEQTLLGGTAEFGKNRTLS